MSSRARNPALDTLRSAAILAVLVAHLLPRDIGDRSLIFAVDTLAQRGVDLFFVLSGYLIGGIAMREADTKGTLQVWNFWQRRWLRTLPAYYATLLLYALKELLPHRSVGLVKPWAFVVFAQTYAISGRADFAHSWSLCVEEHFYLALPLLIVLLCTLGFSRPRHVAGAVGVVALCLGVYRVVALGGGHVTGERLTHYRADGLSIGVLLAAIELELPSLDAVIRRRGAVLSFLAVVFLIAAAGLNLAGHVLWQSAFAIAFGLWVCLAGARVDWLARIGASKPVATIARISYSLYLLHPLVIGTLDQLYFRKRVETLASWSVFVVIAVPASIVAAMICHRVVEQTFIGLRDRWVPARS